MIHDLILNDVALSSFGGWLTKVPPVVIAGLRGTWDKPTGRDGDTFRSEGCYSSYECELEIHLEDAANIDAVNAWLRSATRMRVTPNLFYNHVSFRGNNFEWTEWEDIPDNGVDITLTAHVQPWRYIWPEAEAVTVDTDEMTATITAPDSRTSCQPLITATVSGGDASFSFGVWTFSVSGYTGDVVIDCEEKIIINAAGTESLLPYVAVTTDSTDRWPSISAGSSAAVTILENVTQITVEMRWRTR